MTLQAYKIEAETAKAAYAELAALPDCPTLTYVRAAILRRVAEAPVFVGSTGLSLAAQPVDASKPLSFPGLSVDATASLFTMVGGWLASQELVLAFQLEDGPESVVFASIETPLDEIERFLNEDEAEF